ncbi:MAG: thiosulfate oxidation carrier protein SoxY [Alphaproteobacteria bacterium BRH_c36]|nr:MAG: thiosulfate oxidation carrier protein SoxY [Alphaproteobacteria bacterium BRH_c36]
MTKGAAMHMTRRQAIGLGVGAAALILAGPALTPALAAGPTADEAIKAFTGGAEAKAAKVSLSTPEIAENGNTVPISFSVESPMTSDDHVTEVMLLADGNPRPGVATFHFSDMSGEASASTRIRLAKTQNIVAVAKMSDGSFFMDKKLVKVTIGGCGG